MVPGVGLVPVSMIDAANCLRFCAGQRFGLTGRELPAALDQDAALLDKLQRIRRTASVAMGIACDEEEARSIAGVPIIGFVAPPMDAPTLSGEAITADQVDLTARFLSNGQPHRALPLTASLCTGVAARISGTLGQPGIGAERDGVGTDRHAIRYSDGRCRGHSGIVTAFGPPIVARFNRTARRLFDGRVYAPVAGR